MGAHGGGCCCCGGGGCSCCDGGGGGCCCDGGDRLDSICAEGRGGGGGGGGMRFSICADGGGGGGARAGGWGKKYRKLGSDSSVKKEVGGGNGLDHPKKEGGASEIENRRFEGMQVVFLASESKFLQGEFTKRGGIIIPMSDHNRATHICIDDDKKVIRKDLLKTQLFDEEGLFEASDLIKKNHQLFLCEEDLSFYETFDAYLQKRRNSLIEIVVVPGTTEQFLFKTNGQMKKIIGLVYVLINTLHKCGFSLCGLFNTKNFVIDEAKKETNVRFSNIKNSDLKKCNLENTMMDLEHLNEMIRQEVFYLDIPPHDLNIWLALMMEPKFEDLMSAHVSLLDDTEGKLMSWYELLKNLKQMSFAEFSKLIKNLSVYSNWKEVICGPEGNQFLKETLQYGVDNQILYDSDAFGLLKLMRNCRHHAARKYFSVFMIIVSHNFPNLASDLQKELFKGGFLCRTPAAGV